MVAVGTLQDDCERDALRFGDEVVLRTIPHCSIFELSPAGHRFYTHPLIRLSPHTSAIGPHNTEELARKFARNFKAFATGTALEDLVDIRQGY